MAKSERVPESLQEKFDSLTKATDAFCAQYLNDEYRQMVRFALAALCRKRPSPLLQGREATWAAGVVHALGMVNFLFDKTQTPYCKAPDICAFFGVASSTGQSKSKEVRRLLKLHQFSPEWTVPSKIEQNPLIWMLSVNGMMVDIRHMPLEVQKMAYEKGLIPYIPGQGNTK
ncbi:MAG: DUF6398 domain-containing protein [Methylococcales bacterium]